MNEPAWPSLSSGLGRLLALLAAATSTGCDEREACQPVVECQDWETLSGAIEADGTVSVTVDGVDIPAPAEWNVAVNPLLGSGGSEITVSACVGESHYFEEVGTVFRNPPVQRVRKLLLRPVVVRLRSARLNARFAKIGVKIA